MFTAALEIAASGYAVAIAPAAGVQGAPPDALISAGVLITSLPIIVVYLLLQRRFVQGLAAGALKG